MRLVSPGGARALEHLATHHVVRHAVGGNLAAAAVSAGAAIALDLRRHQRGELDAAAVSKRARHHLASGAGSLGGAAVGAMIGSVFPVVGTTIGALVGSWLGGEGAGRLASRGDEPSKTPTPALRVDPPTAPSSAPTAPVAPSSPPLLLDRATSPGAYAKLGDVELYHEVHGHGPKRVVMLNGGYQTAEDYRFMLEAYPPDEYTFVLLDHRGRGRSTLGTQPLTYATIADDVTRLLDHLAFPSAHFVGHSEGGCVALELLLTHAGRVETATLVGTPLEVHAGDREAYARQAAQMAARDATGMSPSAARMIERFPRMTPEPDSWPRVIESLYAGWAAQRTFDAATLSKLSKPVLVVRTEHDAVVPVGDFDRAARHLPNASVLEIPEGGHAVLMTHAGPINDAAKALMAR